MKRRPDNWILTLDKLWEYKVKARADFRCEMGGGAEGGLDAHHIVPRGCLRLRWDLMNGFCVSRKFHNTSAVLKWLKEHDPKRYDWIMRQKKKVVRFFRPDYEKIYKKLLTE